MNASRTATTESPALPKCTGMCAAWAIKRPSPSNRAQEKSRRSRILGEIAERCSRAPLSSQTAAKRWWKTSRRTGAGRFGDRIVDIPRPNRAATRAILGRLLGPGLPWAEDADPDAAVAAAASFLYAPQGGAGAIATVTFADGAKQDVGARDVVSGALLASSVREAKKAAAIRQLHDGSGLCEADVVEALDQALRQLTEMRTG